MKTILTSLALASAAALGFSEKADAAPMNPVPTTSAFGGRWGVGFGVGVSTGGSRYYAEPAGYWATEYRWVPTTVFTGYDAWNRPTYATQYVQQAFQVWVPTVRTYAPSYGYHARPRVNFGFGVGYRFR